MNGLLAAVLVAASVVPRFAWVDDPIALEGPARPSAFLEASGRKAAFLGSENGSFEAWVYPLKVLHDFDLSFEIERYAAPISGASLAASVDVRPASSTVRYVHDAFTIDATWFVPIDQQGGLVLLDVDASEDVTVHVRFRTDLTLMWPGALGGQYSYWDTVQKAYVLTESTERHAAFVGSPLASEPPGQPAHNLPDAPTSFAVEIPVELAQAGLVPIVIAASSDGIDAARETYERLSANTERHYRETVEHYRRLREERLSIETPDPALDLALEWGKVALDKGFVCNPRLGCGLIAGLGPSGASERPGFGWYFGGDAFMNMWAMTAYGDFETVDASLRFLAARQRADGKMMHELSQSADYLRWFEDFPYGYYHADTTPLYLLAVRDYVKASGDTSFLDELWPSVKRAYEYCASTDQNGDGLMDNPIAGLAAVETGALRASDVRTDVYLASTWTAAAAAFVEMASLVGESELSTSAASVRDLARQSLNAIFVDDAREQIHFALLMDGTMRGEVTVWPSLGLWQGAFDRERAGVSGALDALASNAVGADWGARMLSRESELYDHKSYNNGAVWPFVTGFAALALYEHGRAEAGWAFVDGMKDVTFLGDRGYIPELLSGDRLAPVDAAVPHQLFASAGLVSALLRGLLGMTDEGLNIRIPAGWDFLRVKNLRWQEDLFDLSWSRTEGARLVPHDEELSRPLPVVAVDEGVGLRLRPRFSALREGVSSTRARVLETTRSGNTVTARLEGRANQTYRFIVDSPQTISSIQQGRRVDGDIEVTFPDGPTSWVRVDLVFELAGTPRSRQ